MPASIASPVYRLGSYLIDQLILGFLGIIVGGVIAYTQRSSLGVIGGQFIEFTRNAQGLENEALQQRFNETFAQNPDVATATAALLVPFVVWIGLSVAVAATYYIVLTYRNGQTLGKYILKTKVVDAKGDTPGLLAAAERYFLYVGLGVFSTLITITSLLVYRTFETPNELVSVVQSILDLAVFVLFFVGAIMIINRKDHRGYHDISAGTYVVRLLDDKDAK